jgi:glycerate dehydrogenase
MNITVLDGYALNPGDLSWGAFEAFGKVTVYDRTPPDKVTERAKDAEILIVNKVRMTAEVMDKLPLLRYIGVLATGYDVIDCVHAHKKGVTVTNIPAYGTEAVAQFTFALLLELCHRAGAHGESVKSGKWTACPDFCYWNYPLAELAGKTFGAIGFGKIGRRAAEIAAAFGMKIIAYDEHKGNFIGGAAFSWETLDGVFSNADVLSLHCPLFPNTKGIINAANLAKMKRTAFLINTARGGLVCEQDLADALNNGVIAGAGLDVLSKEPPDAGNPLLKAKNCIITPHIAWAAKESRQRLMDAAADNLKSFLAGTPVNAV